MNIDKISASIKQERTRIRVTTTGGAIFEVNCIEYKFNDSKKCLKYKKGFPKGWHKEEGMIASVEQLSTEHAAAQPHCNDSGFWDGNGEPATLPAK